jgi:hypothetical protein
MKRVMVFGHNVEVTGDLRAYVDSQIEVALRPFGKRVVTVCVRLHQASDPGAPVSCYIRVDLNPSGGVALGEFAPGTKQAVAAAIGRIGAAVGREIGRMQGAARSTVRSHGFLARAVPLVPRVDVGGLEKQGR